jgi:hypothetical protein
LPGVDKFKRINFPFGKDSKFQMFYELKIREVVFEFGLNLKGVQTFEEKFHKFTKILS